MLPANRHLLPVIGIDIHMVIILGAPVPIPHPFIGLVFDPMDWIPKIGSTVKVHNIPRGNAGTDGMLGSKVHIPMGGPFAMAPTIGHDSKNFFGSPRVKAEGSYFSGAGFMLMSCNDVGMPLSITPGKKFKPIPTLYLPTSVAIPIPAGKPVIVGGPYVPDLMGMLMGLAMSFGFGAIMKIGGKLMKKALTALNKGVLKKFKCTQGLSKKLCKHGFEPVNLITGSVLYEGVDFEIPGIIPLKWERNWYSDSDYEGMLGHGTHLCYDLSLIVMDSENAIGVMLPDGRATGFPLLVAAEEKFYHRSEKLTLTCKDRNQYELFDHNAQLVYLFQRLYDNVFKQVSISNLAGMSLKFFYNGRHNLHKIIDTAGREINISFDNFNRVTKVEAEHRGEKRKYIEYGYNEAGDLSAITDANGKTTSIIYQNHLMVEKTDRNGQTFYWKYDGFSTGARCIHTTGDGGLLEGTIEYKKGHNIVTNSLGESTIYYYDENNLCIRETDPLGNSVYHQYTGFMEPYRDIDEEGNITGYVYDQRGNMTAMQKPDGAVVNFMYDEVGHLQMVTDPLGNHTIYIYKNNLLSSVIAAGGSVTSYEYDRIGRIEKIVNQKGEETVLQYDISHNLIKMSFSDGTESSWEYDSWGRCITSVNAAKESQQFNYDLLDRVVKVRKYDGNNVLLQYDAYEDIIFVQDANQRIRFEYTPLGDLKARIQNGSRIEYNYNTHQRLVSLVNEFNEVYRFKYDQRGKLLEEIGFDGLKKQYIRNRAGKVVRVNRPGNKYTLYEYDLGGRVVRCEYSDGSWEVYGYNQRGELVEAINENSVLKLDRDAEGRVTKESQDEYSVITNYNELGNRIKLSTSLGLDLNINRNGRESVCSLKANAQGADWEARFNYNALALETNRTVTGGITSSFEYDRSGHPIDHKITKGRDTLRHCVYSWNVNDRLHSMMNQQTKGLVQYSYDDFGNLAWAKYEDNQYDFKMPDEVCNVYRSKDRHDRKYAAGGKLIENKGTKYQYDDEGNLISKANPGGDRNRYEWYANGMLKKVLLQDGGEVSFEYDAIWRRTAKIFNGRITRWIWDGNNPVHEWSYELKNRPVSVVDENGLLVKNIVEPTDKVITWLFDEGTCRPCARLQEEYSCSIITNYLGTPIEMFDLEGNRKWKVDYDIYGKIRKQWDGRRSDCPFRYQGQYEDVETGLYYNRFRYYSPSEGMFISQDPVRLVGGIRLYSFIKDTNWWVDLFGLTGTYMFTDGTTSYIGKGPADRMKDSMRERVGGQGNVTQGLHVDYGDPKTGLMVEAELMKRNNAVTNVDFANEINSPGKKMLEDLEKNNKKAYDDIIKKADDFEADFAKVKGIKCK